jgi:hypothetical protein
MRAATQGIFDFSFGWIVLAKNPTRGIACGASDNAVTGRELHRTGNTWQVETGDRSILRASLLCAKLIITPAPAQTRKGPASSGRSEHRRNLPS